MCDAKWYENQNNVNELAGALNSRCHFINCDEMLSYFEKPWKWTTEWEWYQALWAGPNAGCWPDSITVRCKCCGSEQSVDWDGEFLLREFCAECDNFEDMELVGVCASLAK